MRWLCSGLVASHPRTAARLTGSSPPALPARPVENDLPTLPHADRPPRLEADAALGA